LTKTSSPGPTLLRMRARWSAAVPELKAKDGVPPMAALNSCWNASTWGPSGAIQLEAKASRTNISSSPLMWGAERWIRGWGMDCGVGGTAWESGAVAMWMIKGYWIAVRRPRSLSALGRAGTRSSRVEEALAASECVLAFSVFVRYIRKRSAMHAAPVGCY